MFHLTENDNGVKFVEQLGVWVQEWVRGLGTRMGSTLSSCTRQDIKFVGDCKAQITIFNIITIKTLF